MFEIGQIVKKEERTKAAIWCNKNNAYIKKQDGKYVIVANPAEKEPTLEERVAKLEQEYGMTRWQREGILAEESLYSDFTKTKAREIEELAAQLRTCKENLQVEEVVISETENPTTVEEGAL